MINCGELLACVGKKSWCPFDLIWLSSQLSSSTIFFFTNSTFLPLSCKVTHKFWFLVSNKAIFTKHFPCGIVAHTEALIILTAF